MVQMLMSGGGSGGDDQEKVVVVITTCMVIDQTAGCGWSGIKWLANAVSLKPGDHLILVALLHLTNNPRTLSFHAAAKLLGYKGKEDPSEIFGSTSRLDEEELRRRKEEFKRHHGIIQLQKLYEIQKVKVSVEVEAGPSRKVAAVKAAKRLRATWIVLDREMKKDKHYFMDRLSCGISSMKSNNTITEIRGPISEHVSYDEMIPSYSWEDIHLSSSPSPSPSKSPGKSKATTISRKSELAKSSTRTTSLHDHNSQQKSTSSIPSSSNYFKDINTYTTTTTTTTTSMNPKQALKALQEKLSRSPRRPSSKSAKHENKQSLASRTGESSAGNKIDDINNNNDNKNQKEKEFENSICSVCKNKRPRVYLQRDFSYAEIREATKGFSRNNFLSEGGFGFVFEGELKDGLKIAAKQHKAASLQGEKEFKSEVHLLSQARHQNVVVLLGSCSEGSHRLLVYEYVCNGSLEQHLSGSLPHLTWEQRMKIALGAAKGLEYLHSRNIVHRDMRPGNILITHDHESLLGDFGLAKEHHDGTTHHSSDRGVVGTLGYVAPEYAESGKMSTKTDVYSFGVVLLQLITGLSTTDEIPGGKSLVGWAKPLLETKNYPDLMDKRIAESHDVLQLFWMVLVAEKCLKKKPDNRWTMKQVVHNLTCIKEGKTNFIIDFPPT